MGTHPIFESDFDCLTEILTTKYSESEAPEWTGLAQDARVGPTKILH